MWQRNDTGHVQDVADFPSDERPQARPFSVGPGEAVDFPTLLAGFTEVDGPIEETSPTGQDDTDGAKPAKTRKRADAAPTPEGDDQ